MGRVHSAPNLNLNSPFHELVSEFMGLVQITTIPDEKSNISKM